MRVYQAILVSGLLGAGVAGVLGACDDNQTFVPDHAPYVAPTSDPLPCVPNLDGQIDASELQAALGVTVHELVSQAGETRPVNLAGQQSDKGLVWDWSADYASDREATVEASALDGKWYAASFPGGVFTTPFDAGHTLDAVYAHTDTALLLFGLASAVEMPADGQTLLPYDKPVEVYQFPIVPGASYVATGEVKNGLFKGLVYAGRDTYETTVEGLGELRLPDVIFQQAMKIRTTVTAEPAAGIATKTKQISFLFECFGEVARATSQSNEMNDNFTVAAEVRRLGLK
jgi:hypothetical protein